MAEEITDLWREAEEHLRAFEQLARRTVEEAWLAGDALLRIKDQLPHGAWTPALKEDADAIAETKLRLSVFSDSVDQLVEGAKTEHDDTTI